MSYWNSAALYGGWGMPSDLTVVKNVEDLITVGEGYAQADWNNFMPWLPMNIQRTRDEPMVEQLIYQAVGLKHVLDSLAVSAYTAETAKEAEQFKVTSLAYKDAYAPFMRTSLYKGIARYYSGQPPASRAAFRKKMKELALPATKYSRANIGGYLRTAIGSPYIGKVGDEKYRIYPQLTTKGRDRLLDLQERGRKLIGKIPDIPSQYAPYIAARDKARAAALEAYLAKHPKDYSKTLERLKARRDAGWIPALKEAAEPTQETPVAVVPSSQTSPETAASTDMTP